MTVKEWITYGEQDIRTDLTKNNLGGMGGWFNAHLIHDKANVHPNHTWEDYLNAIGKSSKEYAIALKEEILSKDIHYTGEDHQYSFEGVPVFDDNTYSTFSYRGWGDLMAAIYTSEEKPITYMEYYM